MAVQPDGKIVLAGQALGVGFSAAVARLNPDGSLDPSFGTDGKVTVPLRFGGATAVAVQPDGKIVLAGSSASLGGQSDFAAVRLTPTGAPDLTFGTSGMATVDFGSMDLVSDIALRPDGRIVLAGFIALSSFAAAQLTADGSLDPTFGTGGKAVTRFDPVYGEASAMALQPDGKVVLAGSVASDRAVLGRSVIPIHDFAVARLTVDGHPDPTFGTGGTTTVGFDLGTETRWQDDRASAVAVQPDGAIVLAGFAVGDPTAGYPTGFVAAARLTPTGAPDPTFGSGGKVVTRFGPGGSGASAVALQPDGKIILAGVSRADPSSPDAGRAAAVRLLGGEANVLAPPPSGPALVGGRGDGTALVLDPADGSYALGATFTHFPGFTGAVRTATADVTGDGVPDFVGGAGPGGGPHVVVIDGVSRQQVVSLFAFEDTFAGGVFVAAADLDGDGFAEVVVTPDRGGGPVVAVYSGLYLTAGRSGDAAETTRFFGIDDPAFRGGARAAVGDMTGDGRADLAVAAGFGGGPRVALFEGASLLGATIPTRLRADFFAFSPGLRNGVYVAVGDVNGDGFGDLAIGAGPGGGPRVRVENVRVLATLDKLWQLDPPALPDPSGFTPGEYYRLFLQTRNALGERFASESGAELANFFAGDSSLRGGVRLALKDATGDGRADLVTGSGEGEPSRVRVYRSASLLANPTPAADQELDPFAGAVLANGVFVG